MTSERSPTRSGRLQIIVAGGGVGGLTVALALAEEGHEIVVLEQGSYTNDSGAGIQLSPNASRILLRLGLGDALGDLVTEPRAIEIRAHKSGLKVAEIVLGAAARSRYGAPYWQLHRGEFVGALRARAEAHAAIELRTETPVTGADTDADGACAHTGARHHRCDLLIGADGIHSSVLHSVDTASAARFSGYVAWRALLPAEGLPASSVHNAVMLWPGPGAHVVHYPVSRGRLINLVGCVERRDWHETSWTASGTRAQLLRDFRGWHRSLQRLLERTERPFQWALLERDSLSRWYNGRIVLLGDACHPLLPFAAQGAAQAIEDAWVLAQALAQSPSIDAALAHYERSRRPRTERVQRESNERAYLYHQRSIVGRLRSWVPMVTAWPAEPDFNRNPLDWLYGYDAADAEQTDD